jgi:predicted CoA-binding protein
MRTLVLDTIEKVSKSVVNISTIKLVGLLWFGCSWAIVNEQAALDAWKAGLIVVMDKCLMVEYQHLV